MKTASRRLEQRVQFMDTGTDIAQVVIPNERRNRGQGGKRRTVTRKILPGYFLVEMKMDENTGVWCVTRRGNGFVGNGTTPTPLAEKKRSRRDIKADERRGAQG
jgi:transcriptional antiterminator NusG